MASYQKSQEKRKNEDFVDEKKRTYIAIVLDRSGSMKDSRNATLQGVNKQAEKIRKEASGDNGDVETFVSFYTFNAKVEPRFKLTNVNFLEDIEEEDYVCVGNTAMYDAVGQAVSDLMETDYHNKNNSYLVIVVSDGQENKSQKWTRKELATLIKGRQDEGNWTFTYLGANQDLSKVAEMLNIPKGNVAAYKSDMKGTETAWATNREQLGKFFKSRQHTNSSHNVRDFYSENGKDEVTDLTGEMPTNSDLDKIKNKAIWRNKK